MPPRAASAVGPSRSVVRATLEALAQPSVMSDLSAVNKPSKRWEEQDAQRRLPHALLGGTAAMRAAGREFCPQHPAESDGSYNLRLNSTTLYNGFGETVFAQAAKFYGDPVTLLEETPPELVEFCKNVDGEGRTLTSFLIDATRSAFVDGVSFVLVDLPQMSAGQTLADQRAVGAQPYWVHVTAGNLIGWRSENFFGRQLLTQVRIREETTEPDGEFGDRVVKRVRVFEPGWWRVYAQVRVSDSTLAWVLAEEGPLSLPVVPLVPIYVNRTGFFEGECPLRALAELNLEHWVSSSEQRRALSFLRFAMLAIIGATEFDGAIGPDKIIKLPAGADAKYIEHGGAGISSGLADLNSLEKRMSGVGMQLRVENAGSVTATAAALDSAETNAGLRAVAKGIEASVNEALRLTAQLLGVEFDGGAQVRDDFGEAQIPGDATTLSSIRLNGEISRSTYWTELKRRGVLDETFDSEREQLLLDQEQARNLVLQQELFGAQLGPPPAPAPTDNGEADGQPTDGAQGE